MLKNYSSLLVIDRHGNIELSFPNDIFLFYCLISILVTTTIMVVAAAAFSGYNLQLVVIHFDIVIILILVLFILSVLRPWLVLLISLTEQMAAIEVAVAKHIHLPEKRRTNKVPKNVVNAYDKQRNHFSSATTKQKVDQIKKNDPPEERTGNEDDMVTINIDDDKLNKLFNRGTAFR